MLNPYAKAIAVALLALATTLGTGYDDGVLTTTEIIIAISTAVVALGGVWVGSSPLVKTILATVVAGLGALGTGYIDDHLSTQEIITIVVALLGALLTVNLTNNTPPSSTPKAGFDTA